MAKLKEKIADIRAKFGISEEAAREVLALHDNDLAEANALLTQEQNKVVDWNKFWFDKAPQIEALAREYENVKAQLDAIKQAANPSYQPTPNPTSVTPAQNQPAANQLTPEEQEQRIYRNFSQVQEDLWNVQKYHFDNYKTIPDLAPIKKLIEEKKMTPWAAYQEWVAPEEAKRKEAELRAKITAELEEKQRNEATRTGVNGYLLSNRSSMGEEVTSPLDEAIRERNATPSQAAAAAQKTERGEKADPSDFELMSDFVQSLRNGRQGIAH